MKDSLKPDLCVIGAGSGGLSIAAAAAAMGVSVVLIEKGEMGGDCLNTGCVPSKALIAAGHIAATMRRGEPFGIAPVEPKVDFAKTHDHVHGVIKTIAPNDSVARFQAMGVRVLRAHARFTSKNTVEAGDETIQARRFIVATGSAAAVPTIPGLDLVRYFTNETIFELKERPQRLVIIGGGPIGMELAQAFRRLGSDVTVLEVGRVLGREDAELAAPVRERMEAEGVSIVESAKILRLELRGQGFRIVLGGGEFEHFVDGSHLLIAAGRSPNVENLGLDRAGIAYDKKGIHVNAGLRTSNRRVYAIGDCVGAAQFTHAANYHAGLVMRSALFRLPVKVKAEAIPRVTYTDPEIAVTGLTEEQAKAVHKDIRVLRWPFVENDRAVAEHEAHGHIKVITTAKGKILGAGIVGPRAGELISLWTLALSKNMKVSDIAGIVMPYPTLSEVSRRAAITYFGPSLRSPWLQRALTFLRKFG